MARRFLAIAFVLAALAPEAFVSAQQSTPTHSTSHATKTTASAHHSAAPNAKHRHNMNPYANGVYVNGTQYLATSSPKPPPPKNKVNTGNGQQIFKSISN